MKVSLNTIKQYIGFELPPVGELIERINMQLGQVEQVIDLADKYKDVIIVKVVSCEQHENADRLRVCLVDDGGVQQDVERNHDGYVQVVCGAPNARSGIFAAWLPPSATVPSSYGNEPFVLEARDLRGVKSNGMLAASDELAIGSDHDGIVEIDPNEWMPTDAKIEPGASFSKVFGLDDTVIDIENKMFTHRPDCFGQVGVAREIAGILGQKFTSPEWYWNLPTFTEATGLSLELFNDVPEKVPRIMAIALEGIAVRPSPLWLQCEIVRLGGKPINNVVDATNYIMLLTAQPTHAYDYEKLRGGVIGARMAKTGETIKLLNGKTYELAAEDIVIADAEGAIGLAGIMGGGESEVSAATTKVVLEVATFDMYTLRKTSMRHGLFTDALTRFNKGQSPLQNDRVLHLLMGSIIDMTGGIQAGPALDNRSFAVESVYDDQSLHGALTVTNEFINERLGSEFSSENIAGLLSNVEIAAHEEGGALSITAPFWRSDIELAEDIVEEVGRLYGFDTLSKTLPVRSSMPVAHNNTRVAKHRIRESLAKAGANEVLTYSFVHKNLLDKTGQNVDKAFGLGNALSPDLQYYRLSLVPSLLDKVRLNIKAGYDEFTLFEIGKAHHKDERDDDGLPREFGRIAGVYAAKKSSEGAPYFKAKRFVTQLFEDFYVNESLRFAPLHEFDFGEHDAFRQLVAPFDPARSATVWVGKSLAGVVGEFTTKVKKLNKLPDYIAGFELFTSTFEKHVQNVPSYRPLNRFPSVHQDLSLKVNSSISFDKVFDLANDVAKQTSGDLCVVISPVGIYAASEESSEKTITLHFEVASDEHTLTDLEVSKVIDAVVLRTGDELKATRG